MKKNGIFSTIDEYNSWTAMLERSHLAIIQAVESQGSLTAAAKFLCVTQSALSHAVRKLEDQLGCALWLREGRKLRLTQAGSYLLHLADRLLPQFEQAEGKLKQMAQGERGTLRIGMECHPCYQWLLGVVSPFLVAWPDVDVDVKQKFQFGGVGALLAYEIDMLVTRDPFYKSDLSFHSLFSYEQVLIVPERHPLATQEFIEAKQLAQETLFTYPVEPERLDIFSQFLTPAGISPKRHKIIETSDILVQMVASGRGVAALPRWLAESYQSQVSLGVLSLGDKGVFKTLFLGTRANDEAVEYLKSFIDLARRHSQNRYS